MKYNADYFIRKFEAIPDEGWMENNYHDVAKTRFCAIGHCGVRLSKSFEFTPESVALDTLFDAVLGLEVTEVNDGRVDAYPQPTPKARILAALRDIKAKEAQ